MGELRIWKGAGVRIAARGAAALKERTMAERNMVKKMITIAQRLEENWGGGKKVDGGEG